MIQCHPIEEDILEVVTDRMNLINFGNTVYKIMLKVCNVFATYVQGGGVEVLSDIISNEKCSEIEVTEAVSVLAQVTAPWVEDNHSVRELTTFLTPLVSSLTSELPLA